MKKSTRDSLEVLGEIARQDIDDTQRAIKAIRGISDSIDVALRTNKMECLEPSPDSLAMINRVRSGEVSLTKYRNLIHLKYSKMGNEGVEITYEAALTFHSCRIVTYAHV